MYNQTSTVPYAGYYYGRLHSTTSEYEITVRVPVQLKPVPTNGEYYVFSGYLTKQTKKKGQVDLIFSVTAVEGRELQEFSRLIAIYQQKARQGYRDIEARLRCKIINRKRVRIALLYGHNAIMDKDVMAALNQIEPEIVEQCYDFTHCRVSMELPSDIEKELQKLDQEGYDLLAILHSDGSNLSVFDDLLLAVTVVGLNTPFATGIGHEVDKLIIQDIADKSCTTPTAFGCLLQDIATIALAEQKQSELEKAKVLMRMNQQLQSQVTTHIAKINELNREIEVKSAHAVEQAAQIAKLDELLTVNQQEVSQHLLRITELEQEIQRLKLDSERNQAQATEVKRSFTDENALLHNAVRQLSEQVTQLQATIRGLKKQSVRKQVRLKWLIGAGATLLIIVVVIYLVLLSNR